MADPITWNYNNNNSLNSPKYRPHVPRVPAGQSLAACQVHLSSTMVPSGHPLHLCLLDSGPGQPQQSLGPQRISVCTYGLLRHCCVVLRSLADGLAPRQSPLLLWSVAACAQHSVLAGGMMNFPLPSSWVEEEKALWQRDVCSS